MFAKLINLTQIACVLMFCAVDAVAAQPVCCFFKVDHYVSAAPHKEPLNEESLICSLDGSPSCCHLQACCQATPSPYVCCQVPCQSTCCQPCCQQSCSKDNSCCWIWATVAIAAGLGILGGVIGGVICGGKGRDGRDRDAGNTGFKGNNGNNGNNGMNGANGTPAPMTTTMNGISRATGMPITAVSSQAELRFIFRSSEVSESAIWRGVVVAPNGETFIGRQINSAKSRDTEVIIIGPNATIGQYTVVFSLEDGAPQHVALGRCEVHRGTDKAVLATFDPGNIVGPAQPQAFFPFVFDVDMATVPRA